MGVWISGSPMHQARSGAMSCRVREKIYCTGGAAAHAAAYVQGDHNTMEIYDIPTDTWSKVEMPGIKGFHGCVAWDNRLYLIGGVSGTTISEDVWIYDIGTGVWSNGESMPAGVCAFSTGCVDGKIYCFGGRTVNNVNAGVNLLQIYDIEADRWESIRTMDEVFCFAPGVVVEGKIYVLGGWNGGMQSKVRIYDPKNDQWTSRENMKAANYCFEATANNSILYTLGGHGNMNGFYRYDTDADSWSNMGTTPVSLAGICAENLDDRIYLFGGAASGTGTAITDQLHIYIPEDTFTVTCRYQDQSGNTIMPESVHDVTVGESFTTEAMDLAGYTLTGRRLDDGDSLPLSTVTIERVLRNHIITFVYKAEGGTTQPGAGTCCCGKFRMEVEIPIHNNLEVLPELQKLAQIIKGCDCTCD